MPAEHVILLVHGIRDYGLWQNSIRSELKKKFVVYSTNYGRFDLIRFLLPVRWFRDKATKKVWDQIRTARAKHPTARISIIAHSFGTYVVANILQREFDFSAHRVIFCGSVIRYDFPFEQFSHRFCPPILNEVGAVDPWPAVAQSVTWGYGSAGTYGFRNPTVEDRWHAGAGHGFFLDPGFCRTYWIPFLENGEIVATETKPEPPPRWVQILSLFRLKYIIPSLVAFALFVFMNPPFPASHICHPYSPATDAPDKQLPARDCLPGRFAYIKWADEADYPAVNSKTGRFPNDLANRSLSLARVDHEGTPIWAEQNLLRVDANRKYWQPPSNFSWTEIVGDSTDVVPGRRGTLLRRQDPDQKCDENGKRKLLETFIPAEYSDNDAERIRKMCYRWILVDCSDARPTYLVETLKPFSVCVGPIIRAVRDR